VLGLVEEVKRARQLALVGRDDRHSAAVVAQPERLGEIGVPPVRDVVVVVAGRPLVYEALDAVALRARGAAKRHTNTRAAGEEGVARGAGRAL
jgi:hypothetical protein